MRMNLVQILAPLLFCFLDSSKALAEGINPFLGWETRDHRDDGKDVPFVSNGGISGGGRGTCCHPTGLAATAVRQQNMLPCFRRILLPNRRP